MRFILKLLFLLFLYNGQVCSQDSLHVQILPRDNNFADPTINYFLQDLKTAAFEKDTGKLGALVDHENIFAFTTRGLGGIAGLGKNGWESFKIVFHLDKNPKGSYLWKALLNFIDFGALTDSAGTSLFLPGYQPHSHLLYPPVSFQDIYFPPAVYNNGYVFFCMGQNIPVYAKADSSSAIIDSLSYELVYSHYNSHATDQWFIGHEGPLTWRMSEITSLDKKTHGWVDGRKVYPFHFRLTATKTAGKWLLTYYFPPG